MHHILLKTTDGTVLTMEEGDLVDCLERRKSTLAGLTLRHAQIFEADLSWAQLQRCQLVNANFRGSNLEAADFTDAVVTHSHFTDTDLTRAVFTRTNLSQTSFAGANFEHCIFRGNITYKTDFAGSRHWQTTDWAYQATRELRFVFGLLNPAQKTTLAKLLEQGHFNGRAGNRLRHQVLQLPYTGYPVHSERDVQQRIPDYTPGLHNVGEQMLWQIKYGDTVENSPFAVFVYNLLQMQ